MGDTLTSRSNVLPASTPPIPGILQQQGPSPTGDARPDHRRRTVASRIEGPSTGTNGLRQVQGGAAEPPAQSREMKMNDMKQEHPTKQTILGVSVSQKGDNEYYTVGFGGVCEIEPFVKPGMHANIPYIRIWGRKDDSDPYVHAEFCQHNIIGVYFKPPG